MIGGITLILAGMGLKIFIFIPNFKSKNEFGDFLSVAKPNCLTIF
jgi:hypothetical protein